MAQRLFLSVYAYQMTQATETPIPGAFAFFGAGPDITRPTYNLRTEGL